jgi:FkbM family methyltransferase
MKIFYGTENKQIDVTDICYTKLKNGDMITIPENDGKRACLFSDPVFGVVKKMFIENDGVTAYDHLNDIIINTSDNTVSINNKNEKINFIHSQLKIKHGSLSEELPEQKMAVRYLTGNEKVLELGANIGRNSLVIGYIVNKPNSFVTMECDKNTVKQLTENRDLNNMTFHIEASALSKRKLIQKGWDTIASETLLPGYTPVDTITYTELCSKYNIQFDTLVLDCEGAFYYILMDMPEILNGVNLIIMENDYHEISKKQYIDNILKENNFYVDYSEQGGWGPCRSNFFEVWKRK